MNNYTRKYYINDQEISFENLMKYIEIKLQFACDELRNLNYRTFDNADIDFEQQFKEQSEKELKGEQK